jgi:hypothetical protein
MSRRMAVRAAALGSFVLAAVAAIPAGADEVGELLLQDFIDGINASADWKASGAIRSEQADTIAEKLILSRKDPDVSLNIGRLRVTDLEEGEDGGFTASAIEVENATMAAPTVSYTIPLASVADVSVPSAEGLDFDPRRMMSSIGRFYAVMAEAEFSDFEIAEMRSTQRVEMPDPKMSSTIEGVYRNLYIGSLAEGVMSASTTGPITLSATGTNSFSFEIAKVTASEVDVGAAAHISNPRAYVNGKGDGVWHPIMSSFEYFGITGSGPEGAVFGIDRISVSSFDGRQPKMPFFDVMDRMMDPSLSQEEKAKIDPRDILAMYAAWRMGGINIENVSVQVPAEKTSFEMASMAMGGLSNEGIDSFSMSAMRGEGPNGSGSLDALEMRGLKFPDLTSLIEAGETEGAPKSPEQFRTLLAGMPRLSHFSLRGMTGAQGAEAPFKLGSFTLDFGGWGDLFAATTKMVLKDLHIPRNLLALNPPAAAQLDALGFDGLTMSASINSDWSSTDGSQAFTVATSLKDAADVEMSYALSGVTADWIVQALAASSAGEDGAVALMGLIGQLGVTGATVAVTDRSLLDRGLQATIDMQALGVDVPTYKQQLRDALPLMLTAVAPPPVVELIVPPLQSFLGGNQRLVAEISPTAPVPIPEIMAGVMDPAGLVNRLGLAVRSEPTPQ